MLRLDGFEVIMTRNNDMLKYPEGTAGETAKRKADLTNRKNMIDTSDASIAVSIHLNKFVQEKYWGAQTFYPHNSQESKTLAEIMQASIKKHADPAVSDIKNFSVLDKISGIKRGQGGVICLYENLVTLHGNDRAIPIAML